MHPFAIYWQPQLPAAVAVSPQQSAFACGAQQLACAVGAQHEATDAGLVARTTAACMPGAVSWVKVTVAPVNPAAAKPSRYSVRDSAPAMQPT